MLAAGNERHVVLKSTETIADFEKYIVTPDEGKRQETRNAKQKAKAFYSKYIARGPHYINASATSWDGSHIDLSIGYSELERPRYVNFCERGAAYQVEAQSSGGGSK